MPYEDDDDQTDLFVEELSRVEALIVNISDCHVILTGDFNVDFSRERLHTALLRSFCENHDVSIGTSHVKSQIDYTYHFNMQRFNTLDNFLLSSTFYTCVKSLSVIHEVMNLSDHEPIVLHLELDIKRIGVSRKVYTPGLSRAKATDSHFTRYRNILTSRLETISLPVDALLCHDFNCCNAEHHLSLNSSLNENVE
jgi:hypothetical protein